MANFLSTHVPVDELNHGGLKHDPPAGLATSAFKNEHLQLIVKMQKEKCTLNIGPATRSIIHSVNSS